MQTCNRRGFLARVVAGTAALTIVGRAAAEAAPGRGQGRACADCAYFTNTPGSTSGTCSYRGGQPVPADGGCGNFK